jgi:4-hydroxybenzoate polyprenyltransferase
VEGLIRVSHPFPSAVNAVATGGIAILAGADPSTALRVAASMACLQASIGTVNDLVDAPVDARSKPGKPLVAGHLPTSLARSWAGVTLALGLALAAPSGWATVLVAATGVGLGYVYDARLSRTAWSWLPLSLALPLLPIFAWLGATGVVPPGLGALIPVAVIAGGALMVGNGLVDIERDAPAGKATVVVRYGRTTAWLAHAAALAIAVALALILAPGADGAGTLSGGEKGPAIGALAQLRTLGLPVGGAVIAVGAWLLSMSRATIRERGWELEAIGTAMLGLGWLAGTAAVAGIPVGS